MKTTIIVALLAVSASAQTVAISPAVFSGSGLNDASSGGRFTPAPANEVFAVTISATGPPDHFTWTKNGGSASSPIAITGAAQTLADGVTIKFGATTGHTLADFWTITVSASGSVAGSSFVQSGVGALVARNAQSKLRDVVSINDFAGTATQALQAAVNYLSVTGGEVVMPSGSYSLCAIVIRPAKPITIRAYGATIIPTCANQWVLTLYGNGNKILGASFVGTGGTQYQGIQMTADGTTVDTLYNVIKDVYMFNMWNGILDYWDGVTYPSSAAYRNFIVDTTIENFYNQKTWAGSYGISLDGTVNGNSGGNDTRIHGGGAKGYVSNVIVRNSGGAKITEFYTDGGTNGVLYDAGGDLELNHVYAEFNTTVVALTNSPFGLIINGGTQANFTNCFTGSLFSPYYPISLGATDSCFGVNIGSGILSQAIEPGQAGDFGTTTVAANNELDLCAMLPSAGSAQTNCVAFVVNGTSDIRMDYSFVNVVRSVTFYRSNGNLLMDAANVFLSSNTLAFGTAASSHIQFPSASGLGSTLHSNGGANANSNGLWIAANETDSVTSGGTQANAALPSWALDLGGYDNITFPGTSDSFSLRRKPFGGSYASFLKVDSSQAWTFGNGFVINGAGGPMPNSLPFASLGSPGNGTMYYCNDCANVANDSAIAGAGCSGGGHGAIARRENAQWHCN